MGERKSDGRRRRQRRRRKRKRRRLMLVFSRRVLDLLSSFTFARQRKRECPLRQEQAREERNNRAREREGTYRKKANGERESGDVLETSEKRESANFLLSLSLSERVSFFL